MIGDYKKYLSRNINNIHGSDFKYDESSLKN